MLFNSFEFAIFLPIVFIIYWFFFSKTLTLQNLFITFASLVFYGWWDWRFLILLIASSSVDYFAALQIANTDDPKRKKFFLYLTLTSNLGILSIFKYFNFFSTSLITVLHTIGFEPDFVTLLSFP
jgi:D-alanyl-lipoteichoic acid acyltransferase DltB (MBOAT superfamily)